MRSLQPVMTDGCVTVGSPPGIAVCTTVQAVGEHTSPNGGWVPSALPSVAAWPAAGAAARRARARTRERMTPLLSAGNERC